MKRRRLLALLVSMALLCSLAGAPVYATETEEQTGVGLEPTYMGELQESSEGADNGLTEVPTDAPTDAPTEEPTEDPTDAPTDAPTDEPTEAPTNAPTDAPTDGPTEVPTDAPIDAPTEEPTDEPTEEPAEAPTEEPSAAPTEEPADDPTGEPTDAVTPDATATQEAVVDATLEPTEVDLGATDESLADGAAMFAAELPGPTITILSSTNSKGRYCPPVRVDVQAAEGATITNVEGASGSGGAGVYTVDQDVNVFNSAGTQVTITVTDSNQKTASQTITLGHGSITRTYEEFQKPTCTEQGKTRQFFYCVECGTEDNNQTLYVVSPLGHDFDEGRTYSGCSDQSVTLRTCKRCGYIEGEGKEQIENLAHKMGPEQVQEPTCSQPGMRYTECSVCGYRKIVDGSIQPVRAHKLSGWVLQNEKKLCTEYSIYIQKCEYENCDYTDTKQVGTRGSHTFGPITPTKEATCEEPGEGTRHCLVCEYEETNAVIPATGHTFSKQVVDEEPSCTSMGKAHNVCSVCAKPETDGSGAIQYYAAGAKLSHTPSDTKEHDANQHWEICATCHEKFNVESHVYENTGDCTQGRTCTTCGYVAPAQYTRHEIYYSIQPTAHIAKCRRAGCTYTAEAEPHTNTSGNCVYPSKCPVCDYLPAGKVYHVYGSVYDSSEASHWRQCTNPGCTVRLYGSHIVQDDGNCLTEAKCATCGRVVIQKQAEHNWSASGHVDNEVGEQHCLNSGCKQTQTVKHSMKQLTKTVKQHLTCTQDEITVIEEECEGCGTRNEREEVTQVASGHAWNSWSSAGSTCDSDLETRSCTKCGTVETQNGTPGTHNFVESIKKEATCTEPGLKELRCTKCGVIETEEIAMREHAYEKDPTQPGVPATCVDDEIVYERCKDCGAVRERKIPGTALGHDITTYSYNNDATCIQPGTMNGKCSRCAHIETVPDPDHPALGHDWVENYDCTKSNTCSRCDETLQPSGGHAWASTWSVDGNTHYKACTNAYCNVRQEEGVHTAAPDDDDCTTGVFCSVCGTTMIQAMPSHDWGVWTSVGDGDHERTCLNNGCQQKQTGAHTLTALADVVEQAATCETEGTLKKTQYCSACNYRKETTQSIPALGHQYGPWQIERTPDCATGTPGQQSRKCTQCDETESQEIPAEHTWADEYTIDVYETCQQEGSESRHCLVCDAHGEPRVRPKKPHSYVHVEEVSPATCTSAAVEHVICENCGDEIDRDDPLKPALGHDFANYVANSAATCTANATETGTCTRCDATDTREIPNTALGHDFANYAVTTPATCTANAIETAKCARCDATDTREVPNSALGHDFANYAVTTPATCTANAIETAKCTRCDATDTREVPNTATGHQATILPGTAPSCTESGLTDGEICAVCGAVLVPQQTIPATGHSLRTIPGRPATCTESGVSDGAECTVCGALVTAQTATAPLGHAWGGWTPNGNGTHSASCGRCGNSKTEACSYSEVGAIGALVQVCQICGDVIDMDGAVTAVRFEVIEHATAAELDEGAMPAGSELVVRKLDLPFGEDVEVYEAFTVACEIDGVAQPLNGRIELNIPIVCKEPFRLVRVDVTPATETTERIEEWVELEYRYANGVLTFVTDRDGLFLIIPLDA